MALSAATALAAWAGTSRADTFGNIWATDTNLTALNNPSAWTDETVGGTDVAPPGPNDIAQFDSGTGLTAATTFTLGANTTYGGLSVVSPGAAIVIGGGSDTSNTLTLGASGLNMSTANQSLTISDPLAFSTASSINVASGQTFTQSTTTAIGGAVNVDGAGTTVFSGGISGGGSLDMSGTGTMTLSASSAYTGGLTVSNGLVTFGNDGSSLAAGSAGGTGTLTLAGGSIHFSGSTSGSNGVYNPINVTALTNVSGSVQIAAPITGSGELNVDETSGGTMALIAGNTMTGYTGLLELGTSVGTLRFNAVNGSSTFGVDMGTGTANINTRTAGTFTFGSLQGAGSGTLVQGSSSSTSADTFSIGGLDATTLYAGSIQNGTDGANAITNIALTGGYLTLTGANTYTGTTTINTSTLQIGSNTATGTLGTGAVTDNAVLIFSRSDNALSEANAISGTGSVINAGAGTVTLTGANSYSGGTLINSGLLQADNATSGLGSATVTVNSGGGLGGIGNITAPVSIASGGVLAPGDAGISHGSGTGVGTLTVSSLSLAAGSILNYEFSAAANDLTNITTANGLTVAGGGIDLYGAGSLTAFDTNGIYNIFQFPSPYTGGSVSNLLTILNPVAGANYAWGTSGDDITLTITGGATSTAWNKTVGGSWATAGDWTAGVPNSVGASATFGTTLTTPGAVTLDGNETVGNLVFNNTAGGANPSYTIEQGTGTGTLIVDNGGASATGSITVTNGSQAITAPVTLNSNLAVGATTGNTLTISGVIGGVGSITDSGNGVVVLAGNNTYSGGTTIVTGLLQVGNGGAGGNLGTSSAPISNAGTLAFDLSSSLNLANVITGSGSVSMSGTGTVTLSGSNTYGGTTTINGGTLRVGTGVPTALNTGKVAFGGAGVLDVNGNSISLASISGTTGTIDNVSAGGTPTLTFDTNGTQTFSGNIINSSGSLAIAEAGGSTLTLGGANTFTGGTTITTGAIRVLSTGNLGSGPISVVDSNGLVLSNGAVVSNAIVLNNGSNGFEDLPDAGAVGTISGPITIGSLATGQQFRVGTSSVDATTGLPNSTLVLTGVATANSALALFTKGNVIYEGNGSLTTTNTVTIGRSGNTFAMNLIIENSASVAGQGVEVNGLDGSSDDLLTNITIENNGSLSSGAGAFNLNNSANANSSTAVTISMSGNANITAGNFTELASGLGSTTWTIDGGTLTAGASDPVGGQWFPAISNANGPMSFQILSGGVGVNNAGFGITIGQAFNDFGAGGFVNFTGSGTTTLAVSSSYSGNDTLSGGTLVIADNSGTATGSGNLTLLAGAVLASSPTGGGTISGSVLAGTGVGSGAHTIAPGGIGSIGSLSLGGLTTSNQTTLNFDLGTGAGPLITNGDLLNLSGTVSITAGTLLAFSANSVGGDDYQLIGGAIGGINLANFTLPAAPAGQSYTLAESGGFIDLDVIATGPANLTWNNNSGDNLWDTASSSNWNNGTVSTVFHAQDNVTFNDNNPGPGGTAGNYSVTLSTTVSPGSITVSNSDGNYTISGTGGSIGGTGSLTKSGSDSLTLSTPNTYSGGTNVSAGLLEIARTSATTSALPKGALSISGTGEVQLATNITLGSQSSNTPVTAPTSNVNITSLSIGGSGTLDITNNHIIVDYSSPATDPITSIVAWIKSGYAGGTWTGDGITSSTAAANSSSYGIGYADAADPNNPAGLSSGQIEIMYTLLGDANLDGKVNGGDFTILAANFNQSGKVWDQGDFNYDGDVNGGDFTLLAKNFNQTATQSALGAADLTALNDFTAANGISLSNVPEPASMGLLTLGLVSVLSRRRRKTMA